jgi:hypothetical protein
MFIFLQGGSTTKPLLHVMGYWVDNQFMFHEKLLTMSLQ